MKTKCYGPLIVALLLVGSLGLVATDLRAQEVGSAAAPATPPAPSIDELKARASRIADSYVKLEQLILRMAELEASQNPQRAALLKRAAQQSSERLTRRHFEGAVGLLSPPAKFKLAIDEQEQALNDLRSLLELLLSEDRADRLKAEETRIREYIKEVERLIRLQRSTEGRTRGESDPSKLADEQGRIADRTGNLAEEIRKTEEGSTENGDPSESQAKPPGQGAPSATPPKPSENQTPNGQSEPKPSNPPTEDKPPPGEEPKPGEKQDPPKADGEKPQDDGKPPQPQDGSKPPEGQPEGQPSPKSDTPPNQKPQPGQSEPSDPNSQPNQSPSDQQQAEQQDQGNPARKRLQAAEERMKEAQQRLEEAKRDAAVDEQEKARHELEKAKAELEEILRQLREEEIGRTLAMLEGRFRRMLEKQLEIYESTKRLDKIPETDRGRQVDIQAGKLGFEETKLAVEADKALLLLHEEGSSVAFPETVEQMRDDMQQVADRLSTTKLGTITQGIEEEIVAVLEEMIEALQKAQQDLEKQKQQQQQQQPGQPSEKPLVDKIAELKMIRALQMRVNTRTERYSRLLADADDPVGLAEDAELRESLIKLGERQQSVQEVTRDIVVGKNQ